MAKEIVIAGEPIPGEELGPIESSKWWKTITSEINSGASRMDSGMTKLAEWWDRGGQQHMKWAKGALSYMAVAFGCSKARVSQMIAYGRGRWHLSTRVDKSMLINASEYALRPALANGRPPEQVAEVVERAWVFAKREAEAKGLPPKMKAKFVKEALKEAPVAPGVKPIPHPAREKPYTPSILTSPMDDLRASIEAAIDMAGRVKCSPTVPELLRRALAACEKDPQGVLG